MLGGEFWFVVFDGLQVGQEVYEESFDAVEEDEVFGAGQADVVIGFVHFVPDALADGELGGAFSAVDGTLIGGK